MARVAIELAVNVSPASDRSNAVCPSSGAGSLLTRTIQSRAPASAAYSTMVVGHDLVEATATIVVLITPEAR